MATKDGKKRMLFFQSDRKLTKRILSPVKIFPTETERLISITNEMSNGAKLSSNVQNDIILTYSNGDKITFDLHTKTSSGWVPGIKVMSNADKIEKLGKEKDKAPRVDGDVAEQ